MKKSIKTYSFITVFFVWLVLSALTLFILWGMRDRARLIRDNDNERILNMLFTSLRGYDDFGSAIESNAALENRVTGFAVYGTDLKPVYRWGRAPEVFDEGIIESAGHKSRFGRYTIPDLRGRSVKFVLNTERMASRPPPGNDNKSGNRYRREETPRPQPPSPFGGLLQGKYIYIDIVHPGYWRVLTFTSILFPFIELMLLALLFYIRRLYLRNSEYRERIEAQKHLVVLGTAAGTLAHEIKNPLLSIRLQTGILEKILPEHSRDELDRINQEVDRLSGLAGRVKDYLKEGAGNPVPVTVYGLLEEVSRRLCGRSIIQKDSVRNAVVYADPDRLRSVFENLIRNALEAGGNEEDVKVSVQCAGSVIISVFDRGKGVSGGDLGRVFDPFFTRKNTGMGIGLSISKRFIEAAGGSITLENREGGGASSEVSRGAAAVVRLPAIKNADVR
jgi:two-component system sensor histidine kinase HydH